MASAAGMLSFGTVLAQGLGLVNIVLATRIYSQEDFGTYSVFLAFAAIVASVNLLAYDKAIPNVDNDERNEFVLGMLIVLMAFTVLSGLIYSIAHYSFAIAPRVGCGCDKGLGDDQRERPSSLEDVLRSNRPFSWLLPDSSGQLLD